MPQSGDSLRLAYIKGCRLINQLSIASRGNYLAAFAANNVSTNKRLVRDREEEKVNIIWPTIIFIDEHG